MRTFGLYFLLCTLAPAALSGTAIAQCLELQPGFRLPGPSDAVFALETADLGSGSALYVGGAFTDVEGALASHVAHWDGTAWSPLGSGVDGDVTAIAAFDDGSGVGIYAGGAFTTAGGVSGNHIARWDGTSWMPLGDGVDGTVAALAVFDDGTGPALFAGGAFTHAGGIAAQNVAKWNGSVWSSAGAGVGCGVTAMSAFDPGTGGVLCAAGCDVQSWNGSAWSALGPGGPGFVFDLQAFDDGTGPALYAGSFVGSPAVLSKWDGATWSAPPQGSWNGTVNALGVFDDGSGAALFAGGDVFFQPVGLPLFLAKRAGAIWLPVGVGLGTNAGVEAIAAFDDGAGDAVYAAGRFTAAGGTRVDRIARFDGDQWTPLAGGGIGDESGVSDFVRTLLPFDDGNGPALFAGGTFSLAGGQPASNIARWDGAAWSPLDFGLSGGSGVAARSMAIFDDGTGPALYVGGGFTTAGSISASHVAKWDGTVWSELGGGTNGAVECLVVFDDGSGPALFAGGEFGQAGSLPVSYVAKWQGSAWSALGSGVPAPVLSMAAFDDGGGAALFVAPAGTTTLFRWDGVNWTAAGGEDVSTCGITAMAVFDTGAGPELFLAAGACFKGYPKILRWNGIERVEITEVPAIAVVRAMFARPGTGGASSRLWLGFDLPAEHRDLPVSGLATLGGCSAPGTPFCSGDGVAAACPCNNSGVVGHGCANSVNPDGALLSSSGTSSLADDSVVFTATGVRTTGLCIFFQGDAIHAPQRYGDGLTCVGGHLKRIYKHMAVAGTVVAPQGAEGPPSVRSSGFGDPIQPGTIRYYVVAFRDGAPSFCPFPTGSNFNSTNALRVYWHP